MIRYGRYDVVVEQGKADGEGREAYVWEPDEVTLGEQRMITDEFGGTYRQWMRAIGVDESPDALQVLVWFLRRKAGQQMDRIAVDLPRVRYMDIVKITEPGDEDYIADPGDDDAAGDQSDPEASAGSKPAT